MPISWSDAVADADSSDAPARYRRALQQVADLQPLVQSYLQAVRDSGKWPMEDKSEYDWTKVPTHLYTNGTGSTNSRHLMALFDGSWFVDDFVTTDQHTVGLVNARHGAPIRVGSGPTSEMFMVSPDFDKYMDAMDRLKDWLPRELVAHLRSMDIPVPQG